VWTEEVDCIYSGVVPGKKGSAILSTCSASHGFVRNLVKQTGGNPCSLLT